VCIKLVIWKKSILWCTVRKSSNYPSIKYPNHTAHFGRNFATFKKVLSPLKRVKFVPRHARWIQYFLNVIFNMSHQIILLGSYIIIHYSLLIVNHFPAYLDGCDATTLLWVLSNVALDSDTLTLWTTPSTIWSVRCDEVVVAVVTTSVVVTWTSPGALADPTLK